MKLTKDELEIIIAGLHAYLGTFEASSVIYPTMQRDIIKLIRKLRESAQEQS